MCKDSTSKAWWPIGCSMSEERNDEWFQDFWPEQIDG